ncbi:MAG: DUF3857 domain-containing protein, partial [Elusimicrobia bacterium]|nr:DUF3857 domain-containing protein [Elusimicrobiota bacterium]MBD3412028.1 DUF3857 domain-containing protein [Elusimicrobiota bacterium]
VSIEHEGNVDVYGVLEITNDQKDTFAEIQIQYDPEVEDVQIVYAQQIDPDGSMRPVALHDIRDFPEHKIIFFPEVTYGTVIEYQVRYVVKKLQV